MATSVGPSLAQTAIEALTAMQSSLAVGVEAFIDGAARSSLTGWLCNQDSERRGLPAIRDKIDCDGRGLGSKVGHSGRTLIRAKDLPLLKGHDFKDTIIIPIPCKKSPKKHRKVHCFPSVPKFHATTLINMAERFAAHTGGWRTNLHSKTSCDLDLASIPGGHELIDPYITHTLARMGNVYGRTVKLSSRTRLFLVKYDASEGHVGCALHEDGSDATFNILLSDSEAFEGGGSYFETPSMHCTVYPEQGDCIIHGGTLLHKANDVTKGIRVVLIGFCRFTGPLSRRALPGGDDMQKGGAWRKCKPHVPV